MRKICILGATGSIGTQTLELIADKKDIELYAFSYGNNIELAKKVIDKFNPKYVCALHQKDCEELSQIYINIKFYYGNNGLVKLMELQEEFDVINSLVGSVGLIPTIEGIKNHRNILLANKETLVVGGDIVMDMAKKYNVSIIPIDSEHSAIYQLLIKNGKKDLKKIIITASGGSFRNKNINELKNVTVKDALNHPNWQMGNKITIDSCTMMNKAFEIIEAHHLFEFQYEKIETLIHLESIIHSMVVFNDNSVFAQMGVSDMKIPINFALNTPNHNDCDVKELDFVQCGKLSFEKLSFEKYPCFKLAMEVVKKGGLYYTVLNAANEVAVKLFLDGKIKYLEIANIIENEINEYKNDLEYNLENILIVDTFVKNKLIKKYYEGEIKC